MHFKKSKKQTYKLNDNREITMRVTKTKYDQRVLFNLLIT